MSEVVVSRNEAGELGITIVDTQSHILSSSRLNLSITIDDLSNFQSTPNVER